ncbi:hypothetical protein [Kibdelosporangium philippinense]|uniref:hypothetical protein n=1 Tax=Kibdelosporangium philippinense TaxID=211113 RepID=UPI0036243689
MTGTDVAGRTGPRPGHSSTAAWASTRTPAAWSAGQVPDGIIHADHGTQFTSWIFTERTRKAGLSPSLGTFGDPYDNAMAEAFWAHACRPNYSTAASGAPASS